MDPDLQFPNPVERSDLPTPRKKWKYVLGGALTLLLLAALFLPQILSSKLGRNLLKAYLESQYRGQAFMTTFQTSWRGPTTITKFSLTDPEGRQIRFNRLTSPVSLWDLLFGSVHLGDAEIDGLYVEYVVDYGDGTDSIDRWPKSFNPANASALTPPGQVAVKKLPELPGLSGRISLKNAQIVLTRGQILPKQFRAVYRSVRLTAPEGKVEIASLDKPWTIQLQGKVGPEDQGGTFSVHGTLDLGENGKLDWTRAAADLNVSMAEVPNVSTDETSSIGWLLFPVISSESHQQAMGPVIKSLDMQVKGENGRWRFERLEATGQTPEGKETRLAGRPILELDRSPRVLSVNEPATVSVALTADLAAYLSYVNPFLRDVAAGTGWVELKLTEAAVPLAAVQKALTVRGEATVRDAALASGQVLDIDPWPRELTTQWQAVVGNVGPSPVMQMPVARFHVLNGVVGVEPYEATIDGLPVRLEGSVSLKGNRVEMHAKLASANSSAQPSAQSSAQANASASTAASGAGPAAVDAEIGGTLEEPRLTVKAASSEVAGAFEKNLLALRQRKSENLLEASSKQVKGLLEAYDRMNRKGSQ